MPNLFSNFRLSEDYIETEINDFNGYEIYLPEKLEPLRFEDIYISVNNDKLLISLFDKNQGDNVAFVICEKLLFGDFVVHQVKISYAKNRRRGHVTFLYKLLSEEFGFSIVSDYEQSIPGEFDLWKFFNLKIKEELLIFNLTSDTIKKYNDVEDFEIWGVGQDLLLNGNFDQTILEFAKKSRFISDPLYNFILANKENIKDKSDVILCWPNKDLVQFLEN